MDIKLNLQKCSDFRHLCVSEDLSNSIYEYHYEGQLVIVLNEHFPACAYELHEGTQEECIERAKCILENIAKHCNEFIDKLERNNQ